MTKKKLVLISGKLRSGKDTIANMLVNKAAFTKMALADKLKSVCSDLFGYPSCWNYTHEGKAQRIPFTNNKLTVGEILQQMGTDVCRKFNPELWCEHLFYKIQNSNINKIVVPDCRFANEVDFFARTFTEESLIIYVTRPETRKGEDTRDLSHPSERTEEVLSLAREKYLDKLIEIDNSGTLEDLDEQISKLLWI